jgi:hypothetical protein
MAYPDFLSKTRLQLILVLVLLCVGTFYYGSTELEVTDGALNAIVASQVEQEHIYDNQSAPSKTSFKSMDVILNETNQVFITMPAKAAGTSMKSFTKKCMNLILRDNLLNWKETIENALTTSYELPSIIASHLYSDRPFMSLVKGATRETLIIYIHREELPRIRSAIKHVLISRVCVRDKLGTGLMEKYHFDIERNDKKCIIDEESLLKLIKGRVHEVGYGAPEILTCGYFDAIAQNIPSNLMIVHYNQADKLQKMLAKYHCPHLVKDLPIAENVASNKKAIKLLVRLKSNTSRSVIFEEWFDKKQNLMLWALDSNAKIDCKSKITDMEDHLFSCPDEAVTLFQDEFQCVSLSNGAD